MKHQFSPRVRHFLFSLLVILILVGLCYFVCLGLGSLELKSYFLNTLGRALLFSGVRFMVGPSFSCFFFLILFSLSDAWSGELAKHMNPTSREDSFGIPVLMEPFPETEMEGASAGSSIPRVDEAGPPPLVHNSSLEASMRNRIARLEGDGSPYLLDKEKGNYWSDIKVELDNAPSQGEYKRLLEFESRDLQIRELKHECLRLFEEVLNQNPPLADQAPYKPQEAFNDFLGQHRDQLDQRELEVDVVERDKEEIKFLYIVRQGLKKDGPAYVTYIFK